MPKAGLVRFRWSRQVPRARSYRVTLDAAGRWHIAFAAIPADVPGPGTGAVVGVDRGIVVSAALSAGELLRVPRLSLSRQTRLKRLRRRLARSQPGSRRRGKTRMAIARLKARDADRRRDWCEKVSTDLARRFDLMRAENIRIQNMTRSAHGTLAEPGRNARQKSGLNREIAASGWGALVRRLEQKAPGRVERVSPAFTSQTCSACGIRDREARESQAVFRCRSCGYAGHADVNAAINIAAGHAVQARGADRVTGAMKREPRAA